MPRASKTARVTLADTRGYAGKAEEYLEAARHDLEDGRYNAATSAAVHASINAADAITGALQGVRSADSDHGRPVDLLAASGTDGKEASKHLARLIPLKTMAEYDSGSASRSRAESAVKNAARLVGIAHRVVTQMS